MRTGSSTCPSAEAAPSPLVSIGAVDAVIGGWQLSGLFRWTSGFPYTIYNNPADYPTDWYWEGAAMPTVSHVKSGAYHQADGNVNLFPDPAAAESSFNPALPGQVGVRNFVRGDGYFGIDLGLSKRWTMPWNDKHNLALRWEVFNVTNSTASTSTTRIPAARARVITPLRFRTSATIRT